MHILKLPVELIVKVIRGGTLEDILNTTRVRSENWIEEASHFALTQACACFRNTSLFAREIWLDAPDSSNLPLPLGETLATIDVAMLPRLACRAVLIQQRWSEAVISPVRSFKPDLDKLPSWAPWIVPRMGLGFKNPKWCQFLPGGETFLVGKGSAVGVYDRQGVFGHKLHLAGAVVDLAWISGDNGGHLTIGILLITARSLEGSALFLRGDSDSVYATLCVSAAEFHIIHATIRPYLPFTIVILSESAIDRTRTLSVVEDISQCPPIADITLENGWEPRRLITRTVTTVRLPDGVHRVRNFSGRPQFLLYGRSEAMSIIDIDNHSTAPMWEIGMQNACRSHIPRDSLVKGCDRFWPTWTPSGQLFLFVLRDKRVEFWRYPPETSIKRYLDPVATEFVLRFDRPWELYFTFDPIHGILLLKGDGRVLVLQY
ncbi:hypothetical protein B0H11DRAFT_2202081 [Mycena galericulata]|nr:hypothetical protein B0H11DRAFT_2202081 [Mycena galericulata]